MIDDVLVDALHREGWPAYGLRPEGQGVPAKGGITVRNLENWRGRRCTRKELERLHVDEAIKILRRRYAEVNGIQNLDGRDIQRQVVDSAILSGAPLAVKDLQLALSVKTDGILGSHTLLALDKWDEVEIENKLAVTRVLRLAEFTVQHPEQLGSLSASLTRALNFVL